MIQLSLSLMLTTLVWIHFSITDTDIDIGQVHFYALWHTRVIVGIGYVSYITF